MYISPPKVIPHAHPFILCYVQSPPYFPPSGSSPYIAWDNVGIVYRGILKYCDKFLSE